MRRMTYLVMALAMVLGFTQCKKEKLDTPQNEGNSVMITLSVDGDASTGSATGGSKVDVNTTTGKITFQVGDVIHVVSGGQHVGTLERNTVDGVTKFRGTITGAVSGQKLYFYFFGNKNPEFNTDNNGCTVDISDQIGELPVISMGESNETYLTENNYYSSPHLLNKCALVKFSTNVASKTVNVAGMNTVATVNFGTGEITSDTPGTIKFITDGEGEGWAILLEQGAANNVNVTAAGYEGTCDVPAITNNMYYTEGVSVNLTLGILESGDKGTVHYVLYSDYTLYLSGTGTLGEDAFNYYDTYFITAVKKIVFADDCEISKIEYAMFDSGYDYAQLTDVEINTTVPLTIEGGAFKYTKGSQVNFTITAPSVTFIKHDDYSVPFIDYEGGSRNIIFNMSAPITFETYTFNTLTDADAVTIPAGCFYRVVSGYQFNDPWYQELYEMLGEELFWDEFSNELVEGQDYTVITSSVEITSSNASTVFGSATVTII